MPRGLIVGGGIAAAITVGLASLLVYVLLASSDVDYWEGEIREFERRDISNPPPRGGIVFVGGRDIRLWQTLEADMAPLAVVRRGFGGAQLHHLTHYAGRIVKPYAPGAVVVMAGEEDLADVQGRRPEDVLDGFEVLVTALRAHGVDAPVYFISIKPSPMRESRWLAAKRANALIKAYTDDADGLFYIDAASGMFDPTGAVREELFRWDGLTLNDEGYRLLAAEVRPVMSTRFPAN